MIVRLLRRLSISGRASAHALHRQLRAATSSATAPVVVGTIAALCRSTPDLLVENVLLRQQLVILQRSVKRPRCTPADRALLVLLTSRLPTWRQAVLIVQPETVLRWHRALFRRIWRRRSRPTARRSPPRPSRSSVRWPRATASGEPSASAANSSH